MTEKCKRGILTATNCRPVVSTVMTTSPRWTPHLMIMTFTIQTLGNTTKTSSIHLFVNIDNKMFLLFPSFGKRGRTGQVCRFLLSYPLVLLVLCTRSHMMRGHKRKKVSTGTTKIINKNIIMLSNNSSDNNNDNNNNDNRKIQRRLIVTTEDVAMVGEQDDLLLVTLSFIAVPDLLWMKLVCSCWSVHLIDITIGNKLPSSGRVPFKNREELKSMIDKYRGKKRSSAEKIARTHGWPMWIWDVLEATDFSYIFHGKNKFNDDISDSNTANVTTMEGMFSGASLFNGNISSWDTSNTKNMSDMFHGASLFDGDISSWDTSNVTTMSCVFCSASSFNGNISSRDTSNVEDMSCMFRNASSFNRNISLWDMANVTDMSHMFHNASLFDRDISLWDTSNMTCANLMLDGVELPEEFRPNFLH